MTSENMRGILRHLMVAYVLGMVYFTHRGKLLGLCNPKRFVESQVCVQLKELSIRMLTDKMADLEVPCFPSARVIHCEMDSVSSSVSWVINCGWREYVTYVYCENAGAEFMDRHRNAFPIDDGWYVER